MTILTVVRDVCATVGVTMPPSVFANLTGNRTMTEMVSLANEVAQRIAYDYRDWTKLKATATITGDGVVIPPPGGDGIVHGTEAFPLPANYQRMLLTTSVYRSTSVTQPMRFIPDTDEWLHRRQRNWNDSFGEWTLMGGNIHIWPILTAAIPANNTIIPPQPFVPAVTAYYTYLDKNCIVLASGGRSNEFLNDDDSFLLDERVLKLGMIWTWKSQKGSPYSEDMGTYGDALTVAMGHDGPSPIFIGKTPISRSGVSYPWALP